MKKLVLGLFVASTCFQLSASDNNSWFGALMLGCTIAVVRAQQELHTAVSKDKTADDISSLNSKVDRLETNLHACIEDLYVRVMSLEYNSKKACEYASKPGSGSASCTSSKNVSGSNSPAGQNKSSVTAKAASPVVTKTLNRENTPKNNVSVNLQDDNNFASLDAKAATLTSKTGSPVHTPKALLIKNPSLLGASIILTENNAYSSTVISSEVNVSKTNSPESKTRSGGTTPVDLSASTVIVSSVRRLSGTHMGFGADSGQW